MGTSKPTVDTKPNEREQLEKDPSQNAEEVQQKSNPGSAGPEQFLC